MKKETSNSKKKPNKKETNKLKGTGKEIIQKEKEKEEIKELKKETIKEPDVEKESAEKEIEPKINIQDEAKKKTPETASGEISGKVSGEEATPRYSPPKIFGVSSSDIKSYDQHLEKLEKRVRSVEVHAKTDYKFLAYMALILAALSFCFAVYLYNRTMGVSSRLNKSIDNAIMLEAQNRKILGNLEERLIRTEIDYNLYMKNHLNDYLDETIIKLNTIKNILDDKRQEELDHIIQQIQNIKNGVRIE